MTKIILEISIYIILSLSIGVVTACFIKLTGSKPKYEEMFLLFFSSGFIIGCIMQLVQVIIKILL